MKVDLTPVAKIEDQPGHGFTVRIYYPHANVDRPSTYGLSTGKNRKIAERLAAAINAGVAVVDTEVLTDVNGDTYVSGRNQFYGRRLNADLKRLGF
jgi:hypothetical protein|tara:strand:+ start:2450 stop:2737 length:288 start_codon:yes stop_codon:yes gene_type:complete